LRLHPIRPEDTERERRFFERLSERTLALVALHRETEEFVAVGRYAPRPDGRTAEFALVIADDWQRRGLGRALLERLSRGAYEAGYEALYGHVLADNVETLQLARRLGFEIVGRDLSDLTLERRLKSSAR
jgi:acetyltransferase